MSEGFPKGLILSCLFKPSSPLSLSFFLLSLPVKLWDRLQGARPQEQQGQRTQHCGFNPCVTGTRGSMSSSQIILILPSLC